MSRSNVDMKSVTQFKPGSEGLLSPLFPWFEDSNVSEILINHPGEVFVEKRGVMTRFEVPVLDSMHLKRLFNFIANENGQTLSSDKPLLSGNLFDGSRVQLVIPPAAKNYTLSIRRKSLINKTLADYDNTPFFKDTQPFYLNQDECLILSAEEKDLLRMHQKGQWWDFIVHAIALKKNIVISGATSSGKTTFLNACLNQIPNNERIITLEDTYELEPPHPNQVRLFAPKKLKETDSGVSMQDLLQASLRLRPDRIFMGEIRGREVLDFVGACSTGHEGSITSIHANNPKIALMRMTQLYKQNNVPSMSDKDILGELTAAIDIIIQTKLENGVRQASFVYYKEADSLNNDL